VNRPDRALGGFGALPAGCFVRSEFLLMGPARWRRGRKHLMVASAARTVWVGTVLVLVLVPWTVRNLVVFDGQVVPLSNNSGSVARGANCDAAYSGQFKGLWVTNVALDGNDADAARAGCFTGFDFSVDPNEARLAADLRADGLTYMKDHPGQLPGVMAVRLGRTFGLYQFTQQRNFAAAEGRNPLWDGRGTRGL
jgi:hypothetical protein